MAQYNWDTCPDDVRKQVDTVIKQFNSILDGGLMGAYLHGSLATGCFNPTRSDIDILVVTEKQVTNTQYRDIAKVMLEISSKPCPFELSTMAEDYLKVWEHPCPFDFHYSKDWREKMTNMLAEKTWQEWTAPRGKDGDLAGHITIANHRGVTLYGKPLHETLPEVPIEHYRASILSDYYWLIENNLANQVYGILNMCRIWQHLENGAVSSKDEGAVWALEHLPEEHHAVVRGMLETYRNDTPMPDGEEAIAAFTNFIEQKLKDLGA